MDALSLIALQAQPPGQPPVEPDAFRWLFGTAIRVTGTFLGTLVVGALLLALAPDFTESIIDTVEEELGVSFLWGIGIFVALIVVMVLLAITIVGLLVVIPLALLTALLYLVGSAIVFLYIGERLADAGDVTTSRWGHLVVGALVAAVVAAIPFVGGLLNFVVNSVGVGAIAYWWRTS